MEKTSRQKVMEIFSHQNTCNDCLWVGHPNDLTLDIYGKEWGIEPTREAIFNYLNDDCRWIMADSGYRHPSGRAAIDPAYHKKRDSLGAGGFFADAETISELDAYPWPDVADCDFTDIYAEIDKHPDKMVFTGVWSPFFHNVADFFGMENYFVNLHENPALVEALTERVVDYYVAANDKFFAGLGDRADVMFFGNDLGTQLDLFLSPEHFRKYVLPSIKRLIAVGKKYNKKVMMHSCGSS